MDELSPEVHHVAAVDLGLRSDGTGAVVLRVERKRTRDMFNVVTTSREHHLTLAGWYERRPHPGFPLRPSEVCTEIATMLLTFGLRTVWSDYHYLESLRENLRPWQISVREGPGGSSGKSDVWDSLRNTVNEGRLKLPNIQALGKQLKEVRARPSAGGRWSIEQPRTRGSHGDLAAALALAAWAATRHPQEITATQLKGF